MTTFWQCSWHRIILEFSGVITTDRRDVRAKGRSQRSKVKVTEVMTHIAVSGPQHQFEFTYGDEIMHKAWCCLEEVPYCFSRSPVKFQGHTVNKLPILTHIGRFRTVSMHQWLWNDVQSLKQHRRGAILFFKVICQFSRSRGTKNRQFWPESSISGLLLQFEYTSGFEMLHKA